MATAWYVAPKTRGGKHLAKWTIPNPDRPRGTEERQASFKTRREAMDKVNEMSRRIDAGEFKPAQYTFGDAFIRWLEYKPVKEITKVTYRQIVNRQLGQFLEVPVQTMAAMAAEVQDAIFDDYANTHLRHIVKGTFDLAMAEGRISGHRLGMLQVEFRPDRIRELNEHTAGQLNAVIANMPGYLRLAVLLGRGCGLRAGEILAMQTDALHDGYIEVKRATVHGIDGFPKKRREGFKPRKVPIPHWLQPEIDQHVEKYAVDGILFPRHRMDSRGRSRYTNGSVLNFRLHAAADAAGIEGQFSAHQLRKNYATQLRAESHDLGIDWSDVKEWLGHKDLTRDVYAFQGPEVIERGRNLSDPRIEK